MERRILACLVVTASIALAPSISLADEGMWMPRQLPELSAPLEEAGLDLEAASLADLTGHPPGAVVWLGGCAASFVSDQGLVVTNHHCAYGSIQHNSTEEDNILERGFLARSLEEELPAAPGTRVLVTTPAADVTARILAAIPEGATGKARFDAIEAAEKALVGEFVGLLFDGARESLLSGWHYEPARVRSIHCDSAKCPGSWIGSTARGDCCGRWGSSRASRAGRRTGGGLLAPGTGRGIQSGGHDVPWR